MFAHAIKLFRLNGFEIKVDPSWLLIAALITWSLSAQYFPSVHPGLAWPSYLIMALIAMLLFFVSLLLHEMAHSVVARAYGIPIKSITLFLFGGVAELGGEPKSASVEFWIAVAGPVMSLCLGAGFWVLAEISAVLSRADIVSEILTYLALVNIVLAVFNLLPAFPLDGGRILRAALWYRSGDVLKATAISAKAGAALAYTLMVLGVLALFQGGIIAGLWHILIGFFVLQAARSSYQAQVAQVIFANKTVRMLMSPDPIVVDPGVSLAEFVNRVMLSKGVSFVPVVENGALLGHIDTTVLADIDRENWTGTQVGDVFAGLCPDAIVSPDLSIEALLALIAQTGRRKFMVVDGHTLVGIISLADLTRFLHLSQVLRAPFSTKPVEFPL